MASGHAMLATCPSLRLTSCHGEQIPILGTRSITWIQIQIRFTDITGQIPIDGSVQSENKGGTSTTAAVWSFCGSHLRLLTKSVSSSRVLHLCLRFHTSLSIIFSILPICALSGVTMLKKGVSPDSPYYHGAVSVLLINKSPVPYSCWLPLVWFRPKTEV